MRVYIAHGEADQAVADELKDELKPLGIHAETESGIRGFRFLQKSDVVIALWSRNCVFTVQRMMLEKRMLDAWADEQLVLVKLDHHFLPVGMRDLPNIDATFESARKMVAWREVARQVRDRMNALLVAQQQPVAPGIDALPSQGGGHTLNVTESVTPETPPSPPHSAKRNLSLILATALLVLATLAVGASEIIRRINHTPGETAEVVDEPEVVAERYPGEVPASFLAYLQNPDLEAGKAESAKCVMCHSVEQGGPVLLGPPIFNIVGADVGAHEGFGYSSGEAGLAELGGKWNFAKLNAFIERPKSVSADTTMFFAGIPSEKARADLIAYLRTLTSGEQADLPLALPEGEEVPDAQTPHTTTDAHVSDDKSPATGASPVGDAVRALEGVSQQTMQQPLLIAAALAAAGVLFFVVVALRMRGGTAARAVTSARDAAPRSSSETFDAEEVITAAEKVTNGAILFVSYAHADNEQVQPVVRLVEASGREVWIDKGGIQAGEGWAGEIVRAIKAAGSVVVMCSAKAFESDHIKREIYLADRYKKPMLPVFLEAAQPPEDFEYFFAGVQWLELFKLQEADRASAIRDALGMV